MCQAADLSHRLGWLNEAVVARIVRLLERARLPTTPPPQLGSEALLEHMAVDKKNLDGQLRLILLKAIGHATLPVAVPIEPLRQTLRTYGRA